MNVGLRSMVLTGLYVTHPRAARLLHGGKKEETCLGCLPCLPPIPSTHMSSPPLPPPPPPPPQPEPAEDALPHLSAPAFSPEATGCSDPFSVQSHSLPLAFACPVKRPASPSSTWRASPYYAASLLPGVPRVLYHLGIFSSYGSSPLAPFMFGTL